jgi:hypothetical protein
MKDQPLSPTAHDGASAMIERRKTPRIEMRAGDLVTLELRHRVQMLDISQSGALIACETLLPVGTRGHIRAGLAAQPFSAEVAVRRHHPRQAQGRGFVSLGAVFGGMDDRSRRSLELFLPRGKH